MPITSSLKRSVVLSCTLLLVSFETQARFLSDPVAAVNYFRDALAQGNTGGALSMLAVDALLFEEGLAQESRDAYAASQLKRDAGLLSRHFIEIVSQKSDRVDSLAWISTRLRLVAKEAAGRPTIDMTETVVLRRLSAGWAIVHVHRSADDPDSNTLEQQPTHPAVP